MPVVRHPRCFNCHGGIDIKSEAQHKGADQVDSPLDPGSLLTVAERRELGKGCPECHDNIRGINPRLNGWMVAPKPMLWNNKSDEQLCRLFKESEDNEAQFVDHMQNDHQELQFIEAAFHGDRALGPEGMKDYDLRPEPPPGTQQDLVVATQRWVKLLRGNWWEKRAAEAEDEVKNCGCVKPKIELTMKSEVTGTAQGGTMAGDFTATVALKADTPGMTFRGEAPIRYGGLRTPPLPPECRSTYKPGTGVVAVRDARFTADDEGHTKISLALVPTDNPGLLNLSCPGLPRSLTMPAMPFAGERKYAHEADRKDRDYVFEDFEVPANAPANGGRTLIGRKQVTRSVKREGVDVTAKTTFELWAEPSK